MATSAVARAVGKISPASTTFLLCDIQERFRDVIWQYPQVIRTAQLMTAVGKQLEVPTLATEQYPKAFGPTVRVVLSRAREMGGRGRGHHQHLIPCFAHKQKGARTGRGQRRVPHCHL